MLYMLDRILSPTGIFCFRPVSWLSLLWLPSFYLFWLWDFEIQYCPEVWSPKQVRNRSETALKRLNLESFPSPSLTRRGWLLSDHVKAFRTDSGPQRLRFACVLSASFRTVANLSGPIPDRFRTARVAFSLYFDGFFSDRCRAFRTDSGPRVLRLACISTASCRTVVDLSGPIPDRKGRI